MNRSWIWIVVIVALLLVGLSFFFFRSPVKQVNWTLNFREADREPYGLHLISVLLNDCFPNQQYNVHRRPIREELKTDSVNHQTYLFIGSRLYLNDEDQDTLMRFVERGNDAFISAEQFPYELLSNFFDSENYYNGYVMSENKMAIYLNFTHPDLKQSVGYTCDYIYQWKNYESYWSYFDDSLFSGMYINHARLGFFDDQKLNFVKVKYGEGTFYLHTTPLMFTNYHLKNETHLDYADKVFAHLKGSDIYWDEFSKVPQKQQGDVGSNETPLRYLLSQPALKGAWYVMLLMVLLFLFFRIKRDQRIIPVVDQNSNTSLEFVQTISRLYYLQNDHRKLAAQKIKLFLGFIRSRYSLQTKEIDEALVKKLAEKSQVEKRKISDIFEQNSN